MRNSASGQSATSQSKLCVYSSTDAHRSSDSVLQPDPLLRALPIPTATAPGLHPLAACSRIRGGRLGGHHVSHVERVHLEAVVAVVLEESQPQS